MDNLLKTISQDGKIEVYKNMFVSEEKFTKIFEGTTDYQGLVEIDGGTKGYKNFFDRLKEQDILK